MPDEKSYTSSDTMAADSAVRNDTAPVVNTDTQPSGLQTPSELDTDYDSSLAGSGFLEGSWATVSSEIDVSRIDELRSSGEEGEDHDSELSPLRTASAVHSESEIDAFSDSQYESDDGRIRKDRTYEYVTDQSWTDPDKSTPSNSTLSTLPGSYSRGLAAARTPAHSPSSTLTKAHLKQHSDHQWYKAKALSGAEPKELLGDSQVELVFPRISGEFGAGSVDTITSATPLLPIAEKSTSTFDAEQQNFRAVASQQLPEDDYIFLAGGCDEPRSRPSPCGSGQFVPCESASHHAFLADTVDSRRGEKRKGFSIISDRIVERGKHRLYSEFEAVTDDAHAESYGRQQNAEQDQLSERVFRDGPERIIDSIADGYEQLNWDDFSSDSPRLNQGSQTILEARLIGPRTRCPVNQSWLDALSTARSQGLIKIEAPPSCRTKDDRSESLVSSDKRWFDLWEAREQMWNADPWTKFSLDDGILPIKDEANAAVSSHPSQARKIGNVKKIVTIVALPFLVLIMLSRLTTMHRDNGALAVPAHSIQGDDHAGQPIADSHGPMTCPAYFSSCDIVADFEEVHPFTASCMDIPVTQQEAPSDPAAMAEEQTGGEDGQSQETSQDAPESDSIRQGRNNEVEYLCNSVDDHVSVGAAFHEKLASPLPVRRDDQSAYPNPGKRTLPSPRDPCVGSVGPGRPAEFDTRMLERPTTLDVISVSNTSRLTSFFMQSLAITTAMDMAIRMAHRNLGNFLWKHGITWPNAAQLRHSGRRMVEGHVGDLFEDTDAFKKRLRTKLSALLEIVDQHSQELSRELNEAIQVSTERLVTTLKETADAVERHIGADAPIPFIGRHPDWNRTKSTVSTWAEKFWQTLHHATVTLIV